ncbi:guided entry of tail-anchored proteins factor 1-like [Brevipalpus obovatus]|uniref:guided entry of tail-anchored proteins factor 1-like n=1 Tax=Brevipalpus obovatus TaxID=246614 RepID=UPI003D9E2C44
MIHQNNERTVDHTTFWLITFWAIFTACIPNFVKMILWIFFRESELESNLRKQITELKTELGTINMTQEFVKYAKIQRKINKMIEELKNQGNMKTMLKLKAQVIIYASVYIIVGTYTTYLIWSNRYKPLLILEPRVMHPFDYILRFPTGVDGAIGVTFWFPMVVSTSRYIKRILSNS